MEATITGTGDPSSKAPSGTPPPASHLLDPNWTGQQEEYFVPRFVPPGLPYGAQHKEAPDFWRFGPDGDQNTWDKRFSFGGLPLLGEEDLKPYQDYYRRTISPIVPQMPIPEIPTPPFLSTPSLSPSRSSVSSSVQSSAGNSPTQAFERSTLSGSRDPYHPVLGMLNDEREVTKKPRLRQFTGEQTAELKAWLHCHSSDPYPHPDEKRRLATCTGLSVRQVDSWFSRARSSPLAQYSSFQECVSTASSPLQESQTQNSLQLSGPPDKVGLEDKIPKSSSITIEPDASEISEDCTHVAPPKVNGDDFTSSLSTWVNVVVLIQRLKRTRLNKLDEAASSPVNAVPATASMPSLRNTFEAKPGGGVDMELWLSQSQELLTISSSPGTESVNSFESDSPEECSEDEDRSTTEGCWSPLKGLSSENMLSMLQPLFATLPDKILQPLTRDLTALFDSWAASGSSERYSHPSSSPSTPARNQANGSSGSPIEHPSSSGGGKKRPLRDGSESPGDGDDDKDGDEIRKRPKLNFQGQEDIGLRWACPYYQRSPHDYCVETEYGDYRKCAKSPGFNGVHRVKDHIYKCHASIYCDRCYSRFKNEEDLTAHRRASSPCAVQDPRPMEGLTKEQKKLLKPRDRNRSEEARWKTIYKICFPNDEFIPSPYYIYYSRETARLRCDVFNIVADETQSLDDTVRDRILERLQLAFGNTEMRSSRGGTGVATPSSSVISSHESWEAGPSPPSPLAPRSVAVGSIGGQATPAVPVGPGFMALTQDLPFGGLQEDGDNNFLDAMIDYHTIGEGGDDDMSRIFG